MKLTVVAKAGLVSIDTSGKDAAESFSFALCKGMYRHGDGIGCQVNTPAMEADITELGQQIAAAVLAFGEKYPELGILDTVDTALALSRTPAQTAAGVA